MKQYNPFFFIRKKTNEKTIEKRNELKEKNIIFKGRY
jgi:hypothetical protein